MHFRMGKSSCLVAVSFRFDAVVEVGGSCCVARSGVASAVGIGV